MHWKLLLILIPCMLVYAVIGGIAFHFIETKFENDGRPGLIDRVQQFLEAHPCLTPEKLLRLRGILRNATYGGLIVNKYRGELENATRWDLHSSIFLASQIIGAVGYGNITPRTVGGKLFTVLFTCVGIPLFVIFAFGVGRPIARLVRYLEKKLCASWVLETDLPPDHPRLRGRTEKQIKKLRKIWVYFLRVMILFVIGVILFVLIPAAIFSRIEGWSFKDSVYFGFDTGLSIGFGEHVPGDAADQNYRSWYRLSVGVYIYLSVAFFVVVFSPIHEALDFRKAVVKPLDINDPDDPFKDGRVNSVANENFSFKPHSADSYPPVFNNDGYPPVFNNGSYSNRASNSGYAGLYPPPSTTTPLAQGPVTSLSFSS